MRFKKSDRRIKYLTNILHKPNPFTKQNVLSVIECKNLSNRKLYLELFDLIESKGIDINDFEQLKNWAIKNWNERSRKRFHKLFTNLLKDKNVRTK